MIIDLENKLLTTENDLSEAIESEIKLKENVMKMQTIINSLKFENEILQKDSNLNEIASYSKKIFSSYKVINYFFYFIIILSTENKK